MAAKLGASDAAFRLGNQTVSVYLGAVEVYTPALTLYFDGAVDGDWAELGNWWLDDEHTVAATALPTAADSVIITASLTSNSGSAPTVVNLTVSGFANFSINITVTGMATFVDSATNGSTITGNATFNDFSYNNGNITGTATFGEAAGQCGTAGVNIPDPPPTGPCG